MSRTNVLFILTDDEGPWAAGCYGNREIRTPSIDRLAAEGMRFTNFFCTSPVCSPSRATLLTGRIPSQHGVHDWIKCGNVGPDAVEYLEGETTYTDVMAAAGWNVGISGKWHLGASQLAQHGFGDWFVHQSGASDYTNAPMVRDGELVNEPGYVTDAITDEALRMMERYAADEKPFYLSVHYTAPHSPWIGQHPEEIVDSYEECAFESCPQEPRHPWAGRLTDEHLGNRESLKGYFAAVTAMDVNVGRLLDRLVELGLRESTLVVFMSDNGFSCGQHGFWGKGNGTYPRNMYESSIKVPAIFSHPGRIPAGLATDEMASGYDVMPTLLEYVGLPPPEGGNRPGTSLVPCLAGEATEGRGSVVVFDEYGPVRMIRTREWKYVYRHPNGPDELWDLANDPDERANVIDAPEHAARAAELKAELDAWFRRYVDPACDGLRQDGKPGGQTERVW